MAAHLIKNSFQFIDSNGNPVSGGTVEFYEPNGSSTPKAVYSDKALTTSAGTSATLNALGMFTAELFGDGDYYMVVKYADASTAYDMEYIEGEGSGNNAAEEWIDSVTPSYISATSFSVAGDLTADFHIGRRVKTENTGGTVYSTITDSAFTTVTTVTVDNDSGSLDSGLSSVELGFLRADNKSETAPVLISYPDSGTPSTLGAGLTYVLPPGIYTIVMNIGSAVLRVQMKDAAVGGWYTIGGTGIHNGIPSDGVNTRIENFGGVTDSYLLWKWKE